MTTGNRNDGNEMASISPCLLHARAQVTSSLTCVPRRITLNTLCNTAHLLWTQTVLVRGTISYTPHFCTSSLLVKLNGFAMNALCLQASYLSLFLCHSVWRRKISFFLIVFWNFWTLKLLKWLLSVRYAYTSVLKCVPLALFAGNVMRVYSMVLLAVLGDAGPSTSPVSAGADSETATVRCPACSFLKHPVCVNGKWTCIYIVLF